MNDEEQSDGKYITPERRAELAQRKTLLAKRKTVGASAQMTQEDAAERDFVDASNRNALIALMQQHGINIPPKALDKWRPCLPTSGVVDGFAHLGDLTCIATDGLQAYYITVDGKSWLGHVTWFHWDTPIISYIPFIDEHGVQKFFKSVKDSGAPPALFKRTSKPKTHNTAQKPKRKTLVELALQALRRT